MTIATSARLRELLAGYRKLESVEDVGTVIGSDAAIRLLSAWRRIALDWSEPTQPDISDSNAAAHWEWIWTGVRYDLVALAHAAGLPRNETKALLRTCASARLCYPDGSLSEPARGLIHARIKKETKT